MKEYGLQHLICGLKTKCIFFCIFFLLRVEIVNATECQAGFALINSVCAACSAGKYKATTGNTLCTDCEAGKYVREQLEFTVSGWCVGENAPSNYDVNGQYVQDGYCYNQPRYSRTDQYNNKFYIYVSGDSEDMWYRLFIGKNSNCETANLFAFIRIDYYWVQQYGLDLSKFDPDYSPYWYESATQSGRARQWAMWCSTFWQWQDSTPLVFSNFIQSVGVGAISCQSCDVGTYSTNTGATSSLTCQQCTAGTYQNNMGSSICSTCNTIEYVQKKNEIVQVALTWTAQYHMYTLGIFTLQDTTYNDNPTYKSTANYFLYYYEYDSMSTPEWILGTEIGGGVGFRYVRIQATAMPEIVTTTIDAADNQAHIYDSEGLTWVAITLHVEIWNSHEIGICEACPANTFSSAGSFAVTSCLCNAGFTGPDGGVCEQCTAGKFKSITGSASCTNCEVGKYVRNQLEFDVSGWCVGENAPIDANVNGHYVQDGYCYNQPRYSRTDEFGNKFYIYVSGDAEDVDFHLLINENSRCEDVFTSDAIAFIRIDYYWVHQYGLDLLKFNPDYSAAWYLGEAGGQTHGWRARQWAMHCSTFWQWQDATPLVFTNFIQKVGTGALSCQSCSVGTYSTNLGATSSSTCQSCTAGTYQNNIGSSTCSVCIENEYLQHNNQIVQVAITWEVDHNSDVLGIFTLQDSVIFNDKPTYKNTAGFFLYYLIEYDVHEWAIANVVGSESRWALIQVTSLPELVTTTIYAAAEDAYVWDGQGFLAITLHVEIWESQDVGICKDCPATAPSSPAGSYALTDCQCLVLSANSNCECDIGHYLNSNYGNGECISCSVNTYQDLSAQISCNNCASGYYQPLTGQSFCLLCGAGNYIDTSGNCNECMSGTYSTSAGTGYSSCLTCADGYYQPSTGQSFCLLCGAGNYVSNTGSCYECPTGTYSLEAGVGYLSCLPCESGKYQPSIGQSFCILCAAGTYMYNNENCADCPAGTYSTASGTGLESCLLCPEGTYSLSKASVCELCVNEIKFLGVVRDFESFSHSGSDSVDDCLCPAGYFKDDIQYTFGYSYLQLYMDNGFPFCVPCQPGQYAAASTVGTACTQCPDGKYLAMNAQDPGEDISHCQWCPANSHSSTDIWAYKIKNYNKAYLYFLPTLVTSQEEFNVNEMLVTHAHCRCNVGYENILPQSKIQPTLPTIISEQYDVTNLICEVYDAFAETSASTEDSREYYWPMLGCTMCPAGKYNNNDNAWNIDPDYDSDAHQRCAYNEYHRSGDVRSMPNIAICLTCPVGKVSAAGAASCSDCSAGSFSPPSQDVCHGCPAGKYYDSTKTINYDTGTFEYGFGICVDCLQDEYQDETGQVDCKPCPPNTHTNGQTGSNTCICSVGNELLYDTCQPCVNGKYALSSAPYGCELCAAGKYRQDTDLYACLQCPDNSATYAYDAFNLPAAWEGWMNQPTHLFELESMCKCNSGYSRSDYNSFDFVADPCRPCELGKYYNRDEPLWTDRSDPATWKCLECVAGKYSNAQAMSFCYDCVANSGTNGYWGASSCQCNAGYTKSGTLCVLCADGKFKNDWGDHACVDCAVDTVSTADRQYCEPCPTYESTDTSNPPQCKCTEGYTRVGALCTACSAGKFKNFVSDDICTNCAFGRKINGVTAAVTEDAGCPVCEIGKFLYESPPTQYDCNDCRQFSTTEQEQSIRQGQCECIPGYYAVYVQNYGSVPDGDTGFDWSPNTCTACEPGKFKVLPYNHYKCDDCALGKYSSEAASVCISCTVGTYSTTVNAQTIDSCTACVAGKYSLQEAADSQDACLACIAGKYSAAAASQCTDCNPGKYSITEQADSSLMCIACPAGKYNEQSGASTEDACVDCEAGKFYALTGALSALWCEFCSAGYWSSGGAELCTHCGHGMTSLNPFDSIETCVCNVGFYENDDSTCSQCPTAATTQGIDKKLFQDCLCNAGYTQIDDLSCKLCDSGEIKTNVGNEDCQQCEDHQKATSDRLECEPCNANEYLSVLLTVAEELHICNNCPLNSVSPEGSVNVEDCKCNLGFTGADGGLCTACAAGTYKRTLGSSACLSCGLNSFSVGSERTSQESCSCNAGYTYEDENCLPCEIGKYKENPGTEICTQCSNAGITPLGSTSSADCCPDGQAGIDIGCRCRIGYEIVVDSSSDASDGVNVCMPCAIDFYQDQDYVAKKCKACRMHYSTNGSTGATTCSSCAHGYDELYVTYTSVLNNITNATTNYTEKTCVCSVGFGTDNVFTTCQKCSAFQFQPTVGFHACSACPNNLESKDGKTCQCSQNYEAFESAPGVIDSAAYSVSGKSLIMPKLCVTCRENEVSIAGGQCRCIPGFSRESALDETQQLEPITNVDLDDMAQFNLTRSDRAVCRREQSSQCIASRRLPPFALKISSKTSFHAQPVSQTSGQSTESTESSSLRNGFGSTETSFARTMGACKMGLLHVIDDADNETFADSHLYEQSLQYCGQNTSHVECVVLVQNNKPFQTIRTFKKHTKISPKQDLTSRPKRLCTACDSQQLDGLYSRILHVDEQNMPNKMSFKQFSDTATKQLSIGKPFSLPATRMISSRLRKMMCAANDNCEIFDQALNITGNSTQTDHFETISNLLKQNHVQETETSKNKRKDYHEAEDTLWKRPWVYCAHSNNSKRTDLHQCHGTISKEVWKNPKTRLPACAAVIKEKPEQFDAPILFCLLNADTEQLCQQIPAWREEIRAILCKASGLCPDHDFFYSPTAFNLRNQEFIGTSVQKFYEAYVPENCAVSLNEPTIVNAEILAQKQFNQEALKHCSANNMQAFIAAVQSARLVKRHLLLTLYWYSQVISKAVQLFITSLIDFTTSTIVAAGGEDGFVSATNTVQSAIQKLTIAVVAFINSLGTFVENLKEPMLKLLFSKGLGKQFQNIIEAVCIALKTVYNYFLKPVMCPLIKLILTLAKILLTILKEIINVIGWIPGAGGAANNLKNFVDTIQTVIDQIIQFATNFCSGWTQNCKFDEQSSSEENLSTTLVATRCWSFYQTYYGDSSSLSCSKADTCRKSRLSGDLLTCGECPNIENANVMDFACDEISKICTCGVPILQETYCLSNEDCLLQDASCKYLDSDLELSSSSINCHQCENMKFCFRTSPNQPGVCACRSQLAQTKLASCNSQNSNQLVARIDFIALPVDDLCLFTPNEVPDTAVSFQFLSLIPCFVANPSKTKCLYVQDLTAHYLIVVETFVSRRLLSAEDENLRFLTRNPICRDALLNENMKFTQKSCIQSYQSSVETLRLIKFDTMLPACTFCSIEDFTNAAAHNPIAILNMIAHLPNILQRHGILKHVIHWAQLTKTFLHKTSQAIKLHVKTNNITKEKIDWTDISAENDWLEAHHIVAFEVLFENVANIFSDSIKNSSNPIDISLQNRILRSTRHLLLFRDLFEQVEATEIQSVDRIHDEFFQELNSVYNYNSISAEAASDLIQSARLTKQTDGLPGLWATAEEQSKKPFKPLFENYDYAKFSKAANDCNELKVLWQIILHAVNGTKMGIKTISNEREQLQSKPAKTLGESWPVLQNSSNSNFAIAQKIDLEKFNDDRIIQITAFGVEFVLELFGLQIKTIYDMIYSMIMLGDGAMECDLMAMNTCSKWKVTLLNSFIVIGIYFSIVYAAFSFFQLGIVVMFVSPVFFVFMLMLSYGFTPGCIGLIPTCLVQDLHSAVNGILPFVMTVPRSFVISEEDNPLCVKKTQISENETEICSNLINNGFVSIVESRDQLLYCISQQPYPNSECLKNCQHPDFNMQLASHVMNWIVALMGENLSSLYEEEVLLRLKPWLISFIDMDTLISDLNYRLYVIRRGDFDVINAMNICTMLNIYRILPYLFFFLVIVSFFAFLILAIAGSFYPWLLFIASLFSSIFAAGSDD